MTNTAALSSFAYVTYIKSTLEKVWEALTSPAFTKQYWFGTYQECDWNVGSPWKIIFEDGDVADTGKVVECDPPRRLVLQWQHEYTPELKAEGYSRCEIDLAIFQGAVKLSILHSIEHPESKLIAAVSDGWPKIMSNLKSLLETGSLTLTPES